MPFFFDIYAVDRDTRDISNGATNIIIPDNDYVCTIKKQYTKEKGVDQDRVTLWKPNDFISSSVEAKKRIKSLVVEHHGDLPEFCAALDGWSYDTISERFPAPSRIRGTHATILLADIAPDRQPVQNIAATNNDSEDEEDVLSPLMRRLKLSMQKREHTPSKGAAPKQYREIQDGDSPLLDRRYATRRTPVAAPIEAYHPVFAYFLAEYAREDLDPPSEIVSHTMKLMDSASQIATREAQRAESTCDALSDLLRHPVVQTVNPNLTSSDHMLLYMRQEDPRGSAAMIIIEEKYELGQSGEGCVQGSLSYHAHWIQDRGSLHKSCICPSFIISIAGPFIAVCGAIWTSDIIIQHLTGYMWMGRSGDIEEDRLLRVSRMFYALQRAVIRLKHYYEHLDPEIIDDKYRRFFPLATSYRDSNGTRVVFKYAAFLKEKDPSCVTFLATLEGSEQKVVVKFVERYGEEEHRLLAQHGYAPRLLYHGHIWDVEDNLEGETSVDVNAGCGTRRMVVMEYVEGKTLDNMDADVSREDVRKALHGIIDIMHQQKMVHGDIRTPNILLTGADQLDVKKRIRVLDFDWAGQEGIVRYPYGLSRDVKWAEGVEDHALIRKEHDVIMIGRV